MVVDGRFHVLDKTREQLGVIVRPVYFIGNIPSNVWREFQEGIGSRSDLLVENEQLKEKQIVLQSKLQRLQDLTEQNSQLRELLNATTLINNKVLTAELIAIAPNPYSHWIFIDKGLHDGIKEGQAVLDESGLFGQVVEVMPHASRVLLLTDSSHSVPVQVSRNGVRSIVSGTDDPFSLNVKYVPETSDIKVGDLLVSSGLGGNFPSGYPVAKVTSIEKRQPFMNIKAEPIAHLNSSRYLLVVMETSKFPKVFKHQNDQKNKSIFDKLSADTKKLNKINKAHD